MKVKRKVATTTKWEVTDYLQSAKDRAAYLSAAIAEANDDPAFIAKVIGDIAKAEGMTKVARSAGMSRESLYKALSGEREPDFGTILKVLRALNVELRIAPVR
jgi:probable addiction module antidote protein